MNGPLGKHHHYRIQSQVCQGRMHLVKVWDMIGSMEIRKKIFDATFSGWAKKIFYVNQGGAKMRFTIFSLVANKAWFIFQREPHLFWSWVRGVECFWPLVRKERTWSEEGLNLLNLCQGSLFLFWTPTMLNLHLLLGCRIWDFPYIFTKFAVCQLYWYSNG